MLFPWRHGQTPTTTATPRTFSVVRARLGLVYLDLAFHSAADSRRAHSEQIPSLCSTRDVNASALHLELPVQERLIDGADAHER